MSTEAFLGHEHGDSFIDARAAFARCTGCCHERAPHAFDPTLFAPHGIDREHAPQRRGRPPVAFLLTLVVLIVSAMLSCRNARRLHET